MRYAKIDRWRWQLILMVCIAGTFCLIVMSELSHRRIKSDYATTVSALRNYSKLGRLVRKLSEAESGQRGFLLTHDKIYLQSFTAALPSVKAIIDDLTVYYSHESQPLDPRLSEIIVLAGQKYAELDTTVILAQQQKWAEALAVINTGQGQGVMARISLLINQLQDEQQKRINAGIDNVHTSMQLSRWNINILATLDFLLLLLVTIWLRREWQRATEREAMLDNTVTERTEQLAVLAIHLQEVAETEKSRLARELHDELGSILTATKMDLAWVQGKLSPALSIEIEKLSRAAKNLEQGIMIKRRIIEGLRPTTLTTFGLMTAARELIDQFAEQAQWKVDIDFPEADPDLSEEIEIAMFRILQESLTNAAKYAKASRIRVSLVCVHGHHCQLEIEDNGIGFLSSDVRPKAAGLVGMRERLRARGGRLDIENGAGRGTLIRALLPLKSGAECESNEG